MSWFTIKQKSTVLSKLRGHRVVRLLAHSFGSQMIHCPQFYLSHALHDPGLLIRSKRKGFTLLNGLTLHSPSYFLGDLESYCFHFIFFPKHGIIICYLCLQILNEIISETGCLMTPPFFPSNIQKKWLSGKTYYPMTLHFCLEWLLTSVPLTLRSSNRVYRLLQMMF